MVSFILLQNFKWIALKLKKMNKGRRFWCHIKFLIYQKRNWRCPSKLCWGRHNKTYWPFYCSWLSGALMKWLSFLQPLKSRLDIFWIQGSAYPLKKKQKKQNKTKRKQKQTNKKLVVAERDTNDFSSIII